MVPSSDVILTLVWCLGLGVPGLLLVLYAKQYCNWGVRQLQKRSTVVAYRAIGAFFLIVSIVGAWSMARDILAGVPVWR